MLKTIEADSIDALVTDPPAGISFMGKTWDTDHGGRDGWTTAMAAIFTEALRVLKPGAHGLVWALPRTSHWTATALEDAGFEVRDVLTHHFGTGFPKSLDVSKAIDKAAGAEREVVGSKLGLPGYSLNPNVGSGVAMEGNVDGSLRKPELEVQITAPATETAARWQGWGTALKPASEHWILVRKPLSERNVAANVLKHGTGALNIDACRIEGVVPQVTQGAEDRVFGGGNGLRSQPSISNPSPLGRWPANLVLSHSPECKVMGSRTVKSDTHYANGRGADGVITTGLRGADASGDSYLSTETVETWECVEGCPVTELDRQSGTLRARGNQNPTKRAPYKASSYMVAGSDGHTDSGDTGGASRFFYVAKASRSERSLGLEAFEKKPILWSSGTQNPGSFQAEGTDRSARNHHPTVKSVALMDWLCRLVTPPGGTVLDPFMGSGSTGVAAVLAGFNFLGIEREPDYWEIARTRILHAAGKTPE